jgi:hypothetical protein
VNSNRTPLAIRPRSTGEILDDALRLCLAEAPLFLAGSLLFLAPAAVSLLMLLAQPRPTSIWLRLILPAVTAILFALTGLSSALSQELCARRTQDEPMTTTAWLRGFAGSALGHVSLRALCLLPYAGTAAIVVAFARVADESAASSRPIFAGAIALAIVRLVLGPPLFSAHPAWTTSPRSTFGALRASFQDGLRQPGKAMVLVMVQILLFAIAVINLHLFIELGLSVVGDLIGLDTALVQHVLSPGNPVYVLSLSLLVWMVMAPFSEAVQFLFHADNRARHEGLDLWLRVERAFPARTAARIGSAVAVLLLLVPSAAAAEVSPSTLKRVREEVHKLHEAEPYPGGPAVQARLQALADELDPHGSTARGDFRWFHRDIETFRRLPEAEARATLEQMERNLMLVEQNLGRREGQGHRLTRDELKSLAPPTDDSDDRPPSTDESSTDKGRVKKDNEVETVEGPRGKRGSSVVGPAGWSGFRILGWAVIGGLLLLIVIGAGVLVWSFRGPRLKRGSQRAPVSTRLASPDRMAELLQQDPHVLWREADRLAGEGNRLEALRCLYAALLGLLHRAGMIKLESARTNGEYVRELQRNCREPSPLPESFSHLTTTFEHKWYGEKACQPQEYVACRDEAEAIRQQAV